MGKRISISYENIEKLNLIAQSLHMTKSAAFILSCAAFTSSGNKIEWDFGSLIDGDMLDSDKHKAVFPITLSSDECTSFIEEDIEKAQLKLKIPKYIYRSLAIDKILSFIISDTGIIGNLIARYKESLNPPEAKDTLEDDQDVFDFFNPSPEVVAEREARDKELQDQLKAIEEAKAKDWNVRDVKSIDVVSEVDLERI